MKTNSTEKHFLLILLGIVTILTLAIIYPFLSVIVLAVAFTVVLNPVYKWTLKHCGNTPWLASLLTLVSFLVVLCIPLFFVGNIIFHQAQNAYTYINQGSSPSEFIQSIDMRINKLMPAGFHVDVHEKIINLLSFVSNNITSFFTSTFKTGLMFGITIITIFYLLKDGEQWKKNLIALSPISEGNSKEIITNLNNSINSTLRGSFLVAIIQGILVGAGLTIFGISNAALWGVVASIASFMPGIGIGMIYIPSILYLYFTGMHLQAIGLLAWFTTFVILVDNILSPYFISRNSDVPSLFILFSILGGISIMGPIGILIGPIVLSLLYSLISIYKKEVARS